MNIDTFSWYVPQFMLMSVTYWLWITYAKYPLPMICSVHKHCPPFTERTSIVIRHHTNPFVDIDRTQQTVQLSKQCCLVNCTLNRVHCRSWSTVVVVACSGRRRALSKLHNSRVWRGATIQNNYIFCCCCCCGATLLLLGQPAHLVYCGPRCCLVAFTMDGGRMKW